MRSIAALIFWLLIPVSVLAEPVVVRSGNHDGFTRLVLYLPQGTEWSISEEERRVIVATTPPATFDTSAVYDRIDRSRLKDLTPGAAPGELRLDLGCDCGLRTETLVGNALVVDLVPGLQTAQRPVARPAASVGTAEPEALAARPVAQPKIDEARRLTDRLTMPFGDLNEAGVARAQRLAEVENDILQQVARATTQGLLVPSLTAPAEPAQPAPKAREDSPVTPTQTPAPPPAALAHTAIIEPDDHGLNLTSDGLSCVPDQKLDLATWAGEEGFAIGLGRLRTALTEEFDRTNGDVALQMAQFYISYGFGAEARSILRLIPSAEDHDLLVSMTRILDRGHDPDPSPLSGQTDCDAAVALWSVLATENLAPATTIEEPAILRTLNALPATVREQIGSLLAERLLSAGRTDAAQAVMRVINRDDAPADDRTNLVTGLMELETGDAEEGRDILADTAEQGRDTSPEALIALVEHDLASGQPVSSDTAELISAYVFQYRSAPIAEKLRQVEVLARASAGQYDTAFGLLDRPKAEEALGAAAGDIRSQATDMLTAQADDATFLRIGLQQADQHAEDLMVATTDRLATRILSLGFADVAARIVSAPAKEDDADRRLIRARAALAAGRPRRAEEELTGLTGPEVDALRAELNAVSGQHEAALQAFEALDLKAEAERQAWLAGDWAKLAGSDDQLNAAAATLMRTEEIAPAPDMGELARNRRLLQDTIAARDTIEGLLSRYQVAPPPSN